MNTTPDTRSADPEQLIADLRRQLAEREAERDEGLQRETGIAEVLQVINSSPGDLTPVFDAILERAMRLCEAPFGGLRRFDGGVFRAMAARDASGAVAEVLDEPIAPDPGSVSERIVLGDEVVHIPDVVDTEAFRSGVSAETCRDARRAHRFMGRVTEERRSSWGSSFLPHGSPAVHRQADRTAEELCGAGGHRNGERAVVA